MIKKVTTKTEIERTVKLANKIWNEHYVSIIGQNQVDYMLTKFQSADAISEQIEKGYEYFLLIENQITCGYLCLIPDENSKKLMISKIYIDKNERGSGFGKQLIDFTKKTAQEKGMNTIWLTVNKYNANAINWYKKLNFKVTKGVQMDIGNNFIMDDFVMELQLH